MFSSRKFCLCAYIRRNKGSFIHLCFVVVCNNVLADPYSLVVIFWERADLFALVY